MELILFIPVKGIPLFLQERMLGFFSTACTGKLVGCHVNSL